MTGRDDVWPPDGCSAVQFPNGTVAFTPKDEVVLTAAVLSVAAEQWEART